MPRRHHGAHRVYAHRVCMLALVTVPRFTVVPETMTRANPIRATSSPAAHRVSVAERATLRHRYPSDVERPATRGDCAGGARPCPFVSCRHHLAVDVNQKNGTVKRNFPDREVWELDQTCSLDVADRGGVTLEEVGSILNLTRERVRQLETIAANKMADPALADHAGDHRVPRRKRKVSP